MSQDTNIHHVDGEQTVEHTPPQPGDKHPCPVCNRESEFRCPVCDPLEAHNCIHSKEDYAFICHGCNLEEDKCTCEPIE